MADNQKSPNPAPATKANGDVSTRTPAEAEGTDASAVKPPSTSAVPNGQPVAGRPPSGSVRLFLPAEATAPAPGSSSTPSTPSNESSGEEGGEGVEGTRRAYDWDTDEPLAKNFRQLGHLLSQAVPGLYQHAEGGLILVADDRFRRITSAKELAPLLIDTIDISVWKDGKRRGELPADGILNKMLAAKSFLDNFRKVQGVVTTAVVLPDFTQAKPGFNQSGGILYLGPAVTPASCIDTITKFLGVMDWHADSDRTNALAALLTVSFRFHFPGGKPLILTTASKSHTGKTTLCEFIRGKMARADILFESDDWPMKNDLAEQVQQRPEIGVISLDNVRTDSAGRAKLIRTGYLESFITNHEPILNSSKSKGMIHTSNHFVVILNTNEGSLSIDLLNRSLPIRLNLIGDVTERNASRKEQLGGLNLKDQWLPLHRDQIESEVWGMIDRWVKAGKPKDESVRHPSMVPWAQVVGGILKLHGFTDFLANQFDARHAADPVREAISTLAFAAGNMPRRAADLAKIVVDQGLQKVLLPGVDSANEAARTRRIGVTLAPFVGDTFAYRTAEEKVTVRLKKQKGRFGQSEGKEHFRYSFEEVNREPDAEDGGPVHGEPGCEFGGPLTSRAAFHAPDLENYEPERIPNGNN